MDFLNGRAYDIKFSTKYIFFKIRVIKSNYFLVNLFRRLLINFSTYDMI